MLFSPGQVPVTVPYDDLERAEPLTPRPVDRGSRAETVTYGGGLRATSRRIAGACLLALVLATALGVVIYLVNAESANRYSAAVVPANVIDLNFPATGPLASVLVSPGQKVSAGQVLATQANSLLTLAVAEAKLVVATDKQRLSYLRSLVLPKGANPKAHDEQIIQAQAALAEAEMQLAIQQARLEQTYIRSPISGTVLHTAGVPGELVGQDGVHGSSLTDPSLPQSAVFRLFPTASGGSTDLSNASEPVISLVEGKRWQIIAEVPQSVVTSVHPGEQASFQFDNLGGVSVPAVVRQVVDVPFEVSGQVSYEVLLRLPSRLPSGVLPGMSGTLSFS